MTIVSLIYLIICITRTIIIVFNRDNILGQQLGWPAILMTIVSFIALFITLYIEINQEEEDEK